jgi:hypothetical protein
MNRFVKYFYDTNTYVVERAINAYAKVNNLKIISLTAVSEYGVIVLYEEVPKQEVEDETMG